MAPRRVEQGARLKVRYRNVRRSDDDAGGAHGWHVRITRRGRRLVEYFADSLHGGRDEALRLALERRDELEASLPPAVRMKLTYSLNRTGVVGVHVGLRRRRGRVYRYYAATWTELSGKEVCRVFSVLKYGEGEARRLAIKARREAVVRILSQRGARVYWQR